MKKELAEHILELDGYKCRGCGAGLLGTYPHHIIFKSQISLKDGRDGDWNLITLCPTCHDWVQCGKGAYEDRISGRQAMIDILKKLENAVGFRWGKAYQRLRRKAK